MTWHEFYTGPSVRIIDFIEPSYRGKPCPFTPVFHSMGAHSDPRGVEEPFICQDCNQPGPEKGDWKWDIHGGKFCHNCGYIYIHFDKTEW